MAESAAEQASISGSRVRWPQSAPGVFQKRNPGAVEMAVATAEEFW
jgi:hypothetical protein